MHQTFDGLKLTFTLGGFGCAPFQHTCKFVTAGCPYKVVCNGPLKFSPSFPKFLTIHCRGAKLIAFQHARRERFDIFMSCACESREVGDG